jgi:hypothetical protein
MRLIPKQPDGIEVTFRIQGRPHHFAPNILDFASAGFHAISPWQKSGLRGGVGNDLDVL